MAARVSTARSIATPASASAVALAAGTVTVGTTTDTLRSIELVRGSEDDDTFNATGFDGSSTNAGSSGTFNGFEGHGGNDLITGNGNTRIEYANATAAVKVDLQLGIAQAVAGDAGIGIDTITLGAVTPNGMMPLVNAVVGSAFNDQLYGSNNYDDPATPFRSRPPSRSAAAPATT